MKTTTNTQQVTPRAFCESCRTLDETPNMARIQDDPYAWYCKPCAETIEAQRSEFYEFLTSPVCDLRSDR